MLIHLLGFPVGSRSCRGRVQAKYSLGSLQPAETFLEVSPEYIKQAVVGVLLL